MPEFKCIDCNFKTKKKSNLVRHLQTPKHISRVNNTKEEYSCETCNFYTSIKRNYKRHLLTAKHIKNTSVDTSISTTDNLLKKQIAHLKELDERIKKIELIMETLQHQETVT